MSRNDGALGDGDANRSGTGLRRRALLAATGTALVGATAGCGLLESQSVRSPPVVKNRPSAVYYPSHIEGMAMAGMGRAGRYRFGLTYSFPHRFWLINGDRRNRVELDGSTDVHLMLTAWDDETGRVLPASTNSVTLRTDGERVVDRRLWPMLSQNMSVHFGDNVPLSGEGTYEATVEVGPLGYRRSGALAGAFESAGEATVEFEFSQSTLDDVMYRTLDEQAGERGAVTPMQMDMMPVAGTPSEDAMPGSLLGTVRSGDARLVATRLSSPPAGVEGPGPYLAVSARTPHNGYPLPFMGLTATVTQDGTDREADLVETLDDALGHHYGAVIDADAAIEGLVLDPGAPPQIARHEGYETAFLGMSTEALEP
ncbi:MAG: hypothetical protein V5A43_09280 [Haloarculaceae archaeon]